jgi:uncharacterized membrane protein
MGESGYFKGYTFSRYYPILLIISFFLLYVIISAPDSTARDYQEDLWSEDIQVTDDYGSTYYKSMLNVQETSDGGFHLMYETGSGSAERNLGTVTVDKLGRSPEEWNDTIPLPNDKDVGIRWFAPERGYAYRYVEEYDRLQLIIVHSVFTVEFLEIASDGRVISERELSISDIMDADGTERYLGIVHATWDKFGNAHCVITTKDRTKDTGRFSYSHFYVKVSWHPFAVLVENLHTTPMLFHEDVFIGYLYHRIDVSEQGQVAIAYLGVKGTETHRFLAIKDIPGNWTTVSLGTVTGEYKYLFGTIGCVLIDENLDVHITWAETTAICYARTDINGSIKVQPRVLTMLPVSTYPRDTVFLKPIMRSTSNGDLLIVFNHCPQTSPYRHYSWLPSEVHLVVVPGGHMDGRNVRDITLCKERTSSEAHLYIDEEDNVFVFWFDQRTGHTEIYMRYLAMPGISIEFDPSTWACVQTIRPDETKVVDLGVRNYGSVEVDTRITVETDARHEWWIWLDRYAAHVEAGSVVPFNLTVHCPVDALHGETVTIWINATTSDSEYNANIQLTMRVVWDRGLSVHRDRGYQIVKAGEMTSFHLTVYNIGELDETVLVTVRHVGSDRWAYSPNDMMMTLGPGEGDDFFINVTSPENAIADDTLLVVLEFHYSDGSIAHEAVFLRTVVQPTFLVTMALNRTEVEMPPGATEAIGITVGNVGNFGGTAFVEVSILTNPGEWAVLLETETVLLRSGERRTMDMTIIAPADGRGGDMLVVRVRAYCPNPFSEVTREVVAKVDAVHRLRWTEEPIRWDLYPGDEKHRRLTLRNDGNVFETLRFRTDLSKPGWSAQVEVDGVETDRLRIAPGEEVSVQVLLAVDYGATAGLETFHLYLERGATTIGNVTLRVFVRQVYDVQVQVDVIGPAFVPGGPLEASVAVKNVGNGRDSFCLDVSGLDNVTFLQTGLETSLLEIERGSNAMLRMTATIPEGKLIGEGTFTVTVTSLGDPSERTMTVVRYNVVYPVLEVVSVELDPSRPGPMELVTVRVVLENQGIVELVDISVVLEGGDTERIARIPPGGIQEDEGSIYQYWFPLIAAVSIIVLMFSMLSSRSGKPLINDS